MSEAKGKRVIVREKGKGRREKLRDEGMGIIVRVKGE